MRTRMLSVLFGFAMCGPLGCGRDGFQLTGPTQVATGEPFVLRVGDACPQSHRSKSLSLCWDDTVDALGTAEVGAPFVIDSQALAGIGADFTLHATAEGSSTIELHLKGSLGRSIDFVQPLSAHDIDRVIVRPRCGESTDSPLRVFAGKTLLFDYELQGDGQTLYAGERFPFASSVGTPLRKEAGVGQLELPNTVQSVTLTSPLDAQLALRIETFLVTAFDRVELVPGPYTPLRNVPVGGSMSYQMRLSFGGSRPCVGPSFTAAVFTVETAGICQFSGSGQPTRVEHSGDTIDLTAVAPGTCRVRVDVKDTALSATTEFPVVAAQ